MLTISYPIPFRKRRPETPRRIGLFQQNMETHCQYEEDKMYYISEE